MQFTCTKSSTWILLLKKTQNPTDMGPYYCNRGLLSTREKGSTRKKGSNDVMNSRNRGNKINPCLISLCFMLIG